MALAATTHELLGRARARLGVLRPTQRLARRALFRGMLFATFVVAVSLVGRAWALARLPRAEPQVAASLPSAAPATVAEPAASPAAVAVPSPAAPATAAVGGEAAVNLNTATASELETLPYVGPKRAQAILALRTKLGRFKSVDDLLKVKGIGRATLKRMRSRVNVGSG